MFRSNLWMMNADGSNRRLVTDTGDVDVYGPVWSPDGRWIAYEGDDQHSHRIYVSRPDDSRLRAIPHGCEECSLDLNEPSWQARA
jgi:Tol biopolymer transport system component